MIWMNNTLSGHMIYIIDHMTLRNCDTLYFSSHIMCIDAERSRINVPLCMMNRISEMLQQSNIWFRTYCVTWGGDAIAHVIDMRYNSNLLSQVKQSFFEYAIKDALYEE